MSRLAVFFLLFNLGISFAQKKEYKLVIKDAETLEPVEDVIVTILKSKQNYISNSEGKVSFTLVGASTVQLEHTTYQKQILRTAQLNKSKENVILLKNNVTVLDEVVISFQNPFKKLKKIVENSKLKLTAPCRLRVYSREFYKLDGKYSSYNDGLMNFVIKGKNQFFKNDILIEQNRSVNLVNANIYKDLLGYNLNNIMENYYNFKYLEHLLESDAKKKYDYRIKPYVKNEDYFLLTIKPKNLQKDIKDHYSIVYDEKLDIIIEVSSEQETPVRTSVEKMIIGEKNIHKSNFKNIYRYKNEQEYYLLSSREEIGFSVVDKKRKRSEIEVRNYLITNLFSKQKFMYDEKDVFKEKSLLTVRDKVLTDYWNSSGLQPLSDEEVVIKSIE